MKRNRGARRKFAVTIGAGRKDRQGRDDSVASGVPLSMIIKREFVESESLPALTNRRSMATERFRRLRTSLINQYPDVRVIVVTSASPGEGKSTVATNLALSLAADASQKTLLIDADLRRPSVRRYIRPEPKVGFTDVLEGRATVDHAILRFSNAALDVLPAIDSADNPVELLSSERAGEILRGLRETYARIVIDTPPIVPFTDADAVGAWADGTIVVVRSNATLSSDYEQALKGVTSNPILGAVFNDARRCLSDWHRYSDYGYYDYYYDKEREK